MADFSKGWVKLLRSIQDHSLWQEKPFDKARAWIDLILSANHKDKKVLIGNQMIEVKIGELITSQRKLAERWGWSRNTVRSFLQLLEKEEMIKHTSSITLSINGATSQKITHQLSHLTILNYNKIQRNTTHDLSHERATNRATIEPPIEHKQECKNDKENNIYYSSDGFKNPSEPPSPKERYYQLVKDFFDKPDENWLKEVKDSYPSLDVGAELKKIKIWLLSNYPAKQKKNFKRFAINWLNKELDKPIKQKISTPQKQPNPDCPKCKGTGWIYDENNVFRGKCSCGK